MGTENIFEMRNITKRFPGVLALNNVNMHLKKGEVLGICGENGAGKSTLMKIFSGDYTSGSYEGEIFVNGELVKGTNVTMMQKLGIEMVYQESNVILDSSIAENLFVGNLPTKRGFIDYKKLYLDTVETMKRVELDVDPKVNARFMNSAQHQLLSIMRAVVKKPRIIIFDEPTSSLTDKETDILLNLIDELRNQGVTSVYISHKLEEVFRICDRVNVLRDGMNVAEYSIDEVTNDQLIEAMVGRSIDNMYPERSTTPGEIIMEVNHVSVPHPTIDNKKIVDDVSFNLRKGEILGIGGLVGAGRSETIGAIFGQYTKDVEKEVILDGKKVTINSPMDAISNGIGFVTEERKLTGFVWLMSIKHNISLASLQNMKHKFFLDFKQENDWAEEFVRKLHIKTPSVDTQIVNLSGGNQQKVILGKSLVAKPKVLFIDEPTRGIDVGAKAEIYNIMNELTNQGVSIVMVSSDMPELVSMSDRCVVLSEGKVTGVFEDGEITQNNIMRASI